ncbi:Prolyl 3-hydroxylase OGFOD1 [Orchesella cincta]|uniref:Prolyl 3-hydroxylase OGFOD1 n=1 Tax=Orchesella cincta TaxID=48709 RepID=A0A1D2MW25_ORCCI|nr:Prolyl 3-hydroxylase OGFOD1 [Orchesella cincta]
MSSNDDCPNVTKKPKLEGIEAQAVKSEETVAQNGNSSLSSSKSPLKTGSKGPSSVTPSKTKSVEANALFCETTDEKLGDLRKLWENGDNINDEKLKIQHKPFRHGEIHDFVNNRDFVDEFRKLFSKIEFHEKASDLFQFKQSDDLNSVVDPCVYAINEYLTMKVLPFLKSLTGLPLNQTIDMFLSIYTQTDFLLCHDDELDSRRIAFIWYLSEEWSEDFGGTLDLYSATDDMHPDAVVRKLVPECNKFVFFEVGATSFHQVSEVLKKECKRQALSGWFYGEPLARPKIEFPVEKSCAVLENVQSYKGVLGKFCAEMYLNQEIYSEINEQLSEESEVLVPGFLRDDVYESICKTIVEMDVTNSDFLTCGPANMSNYKVALEGPPKDGSPSSVDSLSSNIESLRRLFYSHEFLSFMEKITEFPFTTNAATKVVSSLQKYSHGSFSLLKSGGAKQTGVTNITEQDVAEEEEEPNLVDVMFFFANKWSDDRGGLFIYTTMDGEQLITVPPEGNCLAVVVRSSTVNSYTNYVNCLSKDDVFFVFKMTFAFDGSI